MIRNSNFSESNQLGKLIDADVDIHNFVILLSEAYRTQ